MRNQDNYKKVIHAFAVLGFLDIGKLFQDCQGDLKQVEERIKASYRKLLLANHPDKYATHSASDQSVASERSKLINDAYDTLTKNEKTTLTVENWRSLCDQHKKDIAQRKEIEEWQNKNKNKITPGQAFALIDLLKIRTFQRLAEIEMAVNQDDPVVRQMSVTPSPYFVLLTLINYAVLTPADKKEYVQKVNLQFLTEFTVNDFDELLNQINWHNLAIKLNNILEVTLEVFFDPAIAIGYLPANLAVIFNKDGSSFVIKETADSKRYETVFAKVKLKRSMLWNPEWTKGLWEVPGFTLDDQFLARLDTVRKKSCKKPVQWGGFSIFPGDIGGEVKLNINNRGHDCLTVNIPETEVNLGLLASFEGLKMFGYPVRKLKVTLEAKASIDDKGSQVEVTKSSGMYLGGTVTRNNLRTTYIVAEPRIFYEDIAIFVNFNHTPQLNETENLCFKIYLHTQNRESVCVVSEHIDPNNLLKMIYQKAGLFHSTEGTLSIDYSDQEQLFLTAAPTETDSSRALVVVNAPTPALSVEVFKHFTDLQSASVPLHPESDDTTSAALEPPHPESSDTSSSSLSKGGQLARHAGVLFKEKRKEGDKPTGSANPPPAFMRKA